NRGYKTRFKGGYFPVAPYDHYGDLRDAMVKNLEACGLLVAGSPPESCKALTLMPKPVSGATGSGMHVHQSLWKDGEPLFYDETGYGGLSDTARWYIGGMLGPAPAPLAFPKPRG